ncbi:acyl-CoA thioesterase [Roseococcus sp. YIM B11640]|uniref:acyl-CoA thioesterase n=1 Tax=Roseococcus sp. YIM B11640 TaxID=3133973 RepID=UPI003C7C2943
MRTPPGRRADYRWFLPMATRWMDNDIYGHMNNVQHYSFFDTVVARFLLAHGVLDLASSQEVGLVVETGCRYHAPVAFPDLLTGALRVSRLGTSSITYGLALFRNDDDEAAAEGHFTHVYVKRAEQSRTVPLPDALRAAAEALAA